MTREIEIEVNETTYISGQVEKVFDIVGDPNVIGGTDVQCSYNVNSLRIEFIHIDVTHLLTPEQAEEFEEHLIEKAKLEED